MHVVATAGHVDHGKSTLVRALTGMEPDRWAEERRRGMTIDLGFAWTQLPSGEAVAFVDVPGHERFVPNMLAGLGPVPAVLFVVAADEGWMPQSAEHLDAVAALGVRHALLAVTRSDLAPPEPARAAALARLRDAGLDAEAVCVSGATGEGIDRLRAALDRLVARLPQPDPAADVRLWVDRAFTINGAGTVVTGTLPVGTLTAGDRLVLAPAMREVRVRGLQALGRPVDTVSAVARVAINLRGVDRSEVRRGHALLTPGRWLGTSVIDVRLTAPAGDLPAQLLLHVGAATATCRTRPLGADTARLHLDVALPLRIGDRAVLRDPGARLVVAGVTVLDVRPPALRRRGAAAVRAVELGQMDDRPDGAAELRRRGIIRLPDLIAMGATPPGEPLTGQWLVDPAEAAATRGRIAELVRTYAADHPLEDGMPVEALRRRLDLPDQRLVIALLGPGLAARDGRIMPGRDAPTLPPAVQRSVDALHAELASAPYAAPEAGRLAELGLGRRELAAAERAGALLAVGDGVYLLPGADAAAARVLADLPQPFTLSQARQALNTTRRVAVPLLELLDRQHRTVRLPDSTRKVVE